VVADRIAGKGRIEGKDGHEQGSGKEKVTHGMSSRITTWSRLDEANHIELFMVLRVPGSRAPRPATVFYSSSRQ
jgi:hypothetical protein